MHHTLKSTTLPRKLLESYLEPSFQLKIYIICSLISISGFEILKSFVQMEIDLAVISMKL